MLDNDAASADMQRLGARSIPIVSKGDKFVFAQVLQDVVDFLGIEEDTGPQLTPVQLCERYLSILDKAIAQTRLMPDAHLDKELPNRPRSWRVLMHHLFQIPVAFLDMEDTGETLEYEKLVAPPPDDIQTAEQIAAFGEQVKAVVQPADGVTADDALAQRLLTHCRDQLAAYKCPRSIDFEAALPRHDTGKLYKRLIRDRYWGDHDTRIV